MKLLPVMAAMVLLGLTASLHAQTFTDSSGDFIGMKANGSEIENSGVIDAVNFYDPNDNAGVNPVINGVQFTGETYDASVAAYTLSLTGGTAGILDNQVGTDYTVPPPVPFYTPSDPIYALIYNGVSNTGDASVSTLTVNHLSVGVTYALQLIFSVNNLAGPVAQYNLQSTSVTDGTVTSNTVESGTVRITSGQVFNLGAQYITDTFVAGSTSEEVTFNGTDSAGIDVVPPGLNGLSGFVLAEVPEPSTWALLLGGLGGLAFWRLRTRQG